MPKKRSVPDISDTSTMIGVPDPPIDAPSETTTKVVTKTSPKKAPKKRKSSKKNEEDSNGAESGENSNMIADTKEEVNDNNTSAPVVNHQDSDPSNNTNNTIPNLQVKVVVDKKKEKKEKKEKKVRKSHNRTPSSYVLFSMEHRKKVMQEFPGLSLGEVSKKCGESWAALDDANKTEWKEKANKLKEEKLAEIAENEPQEPPKKKRKPSNYLCFSMEHRKVVLKDEPTLSLAEVSKRCGSAWKELTQEQKDAWKQPVEQPVEAE